MKKLAILYLFFFSIHSISQSKDPLTNWSANMEDEKRAHIADKIIFQYKYESAETKDSVVKILGKNQDLTAWNYLIFSEFEKAQSNYSLATEHLENCIEQSSSEFLTIRAHNNQAILYTTRNELGNAIDHFNLALELSESKEHVILRAEIYAAMGEFYRKTSDFDVAFEYLDSAQYIVDLNLIYDDINIDILDRKAALFSQTKQADSMVYYSHKALSMAQDQQNLHAQAVSHNELGYYFEHNANFDSSFFHYDRAIKIWKETKAYRYLANAQINKSRLLMKDNRNGDAKNLLFETEKISAGKGWHELYPRLYEHIVQVYYEMGDSINFYKYKDKTTQAYFNNYIIDHEKTILQMQSEMELSKNRDTIGQQQVEIQSLENNLKEKNNQINLLTILGICAGAIILALSILILRIRKHKVKK